MKKIIIIGSLVVCFMLGNSQVYATEETVDDTLSTNEATEKINDNPTSKATISFSTKNVKEEGTVTSPGSSAQSTKPIGRLPSTGESIGIGLSLLGLIFVILFFRKELKNMIENRKRIKGENIK